VPSLENTGVLLGEGGLSW